jgi:leucyl-tRNA synthetase family protein
MHLHNEDTPKKIRDKCIYCKFLERTERRDIIMANEKRLIEYVGNIYTGQSKPHSKYFVTFPYPYMNGVMHLGHGFTLLKADITARFKRAQGYNVLFPFGFHGSGTPIVSCADKVERELAMSEEELSEYKEKLNGSPTQIEILQSMSVPDAEIEKFADPNYWIQYFPQQAIGHLKELGISADFDRSFMTTELNPHYDSFIRWQFHKLEAKGLLTFGKRYMIYSPDNNQPCSDHDRAKGEGVEPQKYTLIKLTLTSEIKGIGSINLLAGTLRPETMYGQTNVWVNKNGTYSLFTIDNGEGGGIEHYIARKQVYDNMIHQIDESLDVVPIITMIDPEFVTGEELVDRTVTAPYCPTDDIPIYHMNMVSMDRGTGIVTSVPSDSPTDYLYYRDVCNRNSEECRVHEIIQVDESKSIARDEVEKSKLKIGNTKKLEELHDNIYMKEHDEGVLLVGKYAGETLKSAHDKIEVDLISERRALMYYEPQTPVVSRTGSECIVALTEQWHINYGDEVATERINSYIDTELNTFNGIAQSEIKKASEWINEWPCSRHYGLGTKLPVDEQYIIDSLSDSTIYMAYYTICNTITRIPAEDIDDSVWNYIFGMNSTKPTNYDKYPSLFDQMKREFEYWYPLDLRISGKDLLKNHLVMSLYNHEFVWESKAMYPKAFFTNGHVMLNGEKMSKSTGNFMTLKEAIDMFGADPTRMALALAGDSMNDSNFDVNNVTKAIMLITNETDAFMEFEPYFKRLSIYKDGTEGAFDIKNVKAFEYALTHYNSADMFSLAFRNEVAMITNKIIDHLDKVEIRSAFVCIFDLINVRNEYRQYRNVASGSGDGGDDGTYNGNMVYYIINFIRIISIFMPHWSYLLAIKLHIHPALTSTLDKQPVKTMCIWKKDIIHGLAGRTRQMLERMAKKNNKTKQQKKPKPSKHKDGGDGSSVGGAEETKETEPEASADGADTIGVSAPEDTTLRSKVGRGIGEHDCSPEDGIGEHDCSLGISSDNIQLEMKPVNKYRVEVTNFTRTNPVETEILQNYLHLFVENDIQFSIDHMTSTFKGYIKTAESKQQKATIGSFSKRCSENVTKYGRRWFGWVMDDTCHNEGTGEILKTILDSGSSSKFNVAEVTEVTEEFSTQMKNGPDTPSFKIVPFEPEPATKIVDLSICSCDKCALLKI